MWLDECSDYDMKLRASTAEWWSAARVLWTDLSLAIIIYGKKKKVVVPKTKHKGILLHLLYSSTKNIKGFWSCNKPFKVHDVCLPHACALLLAWGNYRFSENTLIFQAAQNVISAQVLSSQTWRVSG